MRWNMQTFYELNFYNYLYMYRISHVRCFFVFCVTLKSTQKSHIWIDWYFQRKKSIDHFENLFVLRSHFDYISHRAFVYASTFDIEIYEPLPVNARRLLLALSSLQFVSYRRTIIILFFFVNRAHEANVFVVRACSPYQRSIIKLGILFVFIVVQHPIE